MNLSTRQILEFLHRPETASTNSNTNSDGLPHSASLTSATISRRNREDQPQSHPVVTDYGPDSLQDFLGTEEEEWKKNTYKHQQKGVKGYSEPFYDSRDLTKQPPDILPVKHANETDSISLKEKGKAPLRKQEEIISAARVGRVENSRSGSGKGQSQVTMQTTIHRQRRSSTKSTPRPQYVPALARKQTSNSAGMDENQDPHQNERDQPSKNCAVQLIETPLHDIDLNQTRSNVAGQHFESDRTRSRISLQPVPVLENADGSNSVERTTDTLDGLTFHSDHDPMDKLALLEVDQNCKPENSAGGLRRATSFETHAHQTRDSRRTKDKNCSSPYQYPEEGRRRRKTPITSHTRPSLEFGSKIRVPSGDIRANATYASDKGDFDDFESTTPYRAITQHSSLQRNMENSHPAQIQAFSTEASPVTNQDRNMLMYELDGGDGPLQVTPEEVDYIYRNADLDEQRAILASFHSNDATQLVPSDAPSLRQRFDYSQIVPEDMLALSQWKDPRREHPGQPHSFSKPTRGVPPNTGYRTSQTDRVRSPAPNIVYSSSGVSDFERPYQPMSMPSSPTQSLSSTSANGPRTSLPFEIWEAGVLDYLSSAEVRKLRLVCKSIAEDLESYVFRSVVTNFAPSFFNINDSQNLRKPKLNGPGYMLGKHGPQINKFGIAFEYDQFGMMNAPFKVTEKLVQAWFGKYKWPVKDYPYFTSLKEIDKLLDEQPRLLTKAMKTLSSCHELAISVDSGHGWLEGPDMSDLAVYRQRAQGGSPVFGKTFSATDSAYEEGMKQVFVWAQQNTINEKFKRLVAASSPATDDISVLQAIVIRDYDSYKVERQQPDFEKDLHTGKEYPRLNHLANVFIPQLNQLQAVAGALPGHPAHPAPLGHPANPVIQGFQGVHPHTQAFLTQQAQQAQPQNFPDPNLMRSVLSNSSDSPKLRKSEELRPYEPIEPPWPLIFNGYNISTTVDGGFTCVQNRVANPTEHPLKPAYLTEPQVQWLMETSWIQRTFLSAYTDSIRTNAAVFKNVHSLHISKLSSGLLSSLSLKAFWLSLPALRTMTFLVKPDWRVEHIPGDKLYQTSMNTVLVDAAVKFAEFLRDIVAKIESLNSLRIGYCSGGEHQVGIFGRNQHILPAPITSNPRQWLLAQNPANIKPEENTMFCFPHVRTLTFENCWFSPHMLETLMRKSQDTSLHNLVLDSVSLTAQIPSMRTDGPLRTYESHLRCQHPPASWLQESPPANASWVTVLDKITPGRTILDQKYDIGMIDEEEVPRPEPEFRGNIEKITLKSCGYVKIHNVGSNDFNQNELVFHSIDWKAQDEGIRLRATRFTHTVLTDSTATNQNDNLDDSQGSTRPTSMAPFRLIGRDDNTLKDYQQRYSTQFIMQGGHTFRDLIGQLAHNAASPAAELTGFLTQCIHPVEKRILEQNWGMKFGWGNDMKRYEAVEDGWFMGGTGRFSGNVYKDLALQEREIATSLQEAAEAEAITQAIKDKKAAEEKNATERDNGEGGSGITRPHLPRRPHTASGPPVSSGIFHPALPVFARPSAPTAPPRPSRQERRTRRRDQQNNTANQWGAYHQWQLPTQPRNASFPVPSTQNNFNNFIDIDAEDDEDDDDMDEDEETL